MPRLKLHGPISTNSSCQRSDCQALQQNLPPSSSTLTERRHSGWSPATRHTVIQSHSGQSSQLVVETNYGNAQFLAPSARSALILLLTQSGERSRITPTSAECIRGSPASFRTRAPFEQRRELLGREYIPYSRRVRESLSVVSDRRGSPDRPVQPGRYRYLLLGSSQTFLASSNHFLMSASLIDFGDSLPCLPRMNPLKQSSILGGVWDSSPDCLAVSLYQALPA